MLKDAESLSGTQGNFTQSRDNSLRLRRSQVLKPTPACLETSDKPAACEWLTDSDEVLKFGVECQDMFQYSLVEAV